MSQGYAVHKSMQRSFVPEIFTIPTNLLTAYRMCLCQTNMKKRHFVLFYKLEVFFLSLKIMCFIMCVLIYFRLKFVLFKFHLVR